jgi:FMN phosphatase YigB (HAD superfamily)
MPIKAIVMDFGNTLVDYPLMDWDSQINFTKNFLANYLHTLSFAVHHSTEELAVRLNTENPDGSVWHFVDRIRSSSFFGSALPRKAAKDFEEAICQAVFDCAIRFEDSIDCVLTLRSLGYLTGIVSNLPWGTNSIIWRQEFDRHGFDSNLINEIVCCVDVGYRKPHPAALRACISKLNCDPKDVVFVGDAIVSDIQTALAVGCLPVLVDRRNAYPDYSGIRVRTMQELAFLLDRISEKPGTFDLDYSSTVVSTVKRRRAMAAGRNRA